MAVSSAEEAAVSARPLAVKPGSLHTSSYQEGTKRKCDQGSWKLHSLRFVTNHPAGLHAPAGGLAISISALRQASLPCRACVTFCLPQIYVLPRRNNQICLEVLLPAIMPTQLSSGLVWEYHQVSPSRKRKAEGGLTDSPRGVCSSGDGLWKAANRMDNLALSGKQALTDQSGHGHFQTKIRLPAQPQKKFRIVYIKLISKYIWIPQYII